MNLHTYGCFPHTLRKLTWEHLVNKKIQKYKHWSEVEHTKICIFTYEFMVNFIMTHHVSSIKEHKHTHAILFSTYKKYKLQSTLFVAKCCLWRSIKFPPSILHSFFSQYDFLYKKIFLWRSFHFLFVFIIFYLFVTSLFVYTYVQRLMLLHIFWDSPMKTRVWSF